MKLSELTTEQEKGLKDLITDLLYDLEYAGHKQRGRDIVDDFLEKVEELCPVSVKPVSVKPVSVKPVSVKSVSVKPVSVKP